jgi:hypothetical protein
MTAPRRDRPAQRVVALPCRHCHVDFTPIRPHQRFCQPSCRWEHFKVARQPRLDLDDASDLFAQPFE